MVLADVVETVDISVVSVEVGFAVELSVTVLPVVDAVVPVISVVVADDVDTVEVSVVSVAVNCFRQSQVELLVPMSSNVSCFVLSTA